MRVKSPERRQAIVKAAAGLFRENGFERASMDSIAARVGGSKSTLYNYFITKKELFFAVVEDAFEAHRSGSLDELRGGGTLRARLARFALLDLEFRLDQNVIELDRMLISESGRSDIRGAMHERYVQPQLRHLAEMLKAEMEAGRLRSANPDRTAAQFRMLAQGDLVERCLRGERPVDSSMAELEVAEGVEAFLRAYSPETEGAQPKRACKPRNRRSAPARDRSRSP